ncbi:MAG: hypothetical protein WD767_03805 [Alphaproteobacteria bacterium]
MADYDVLLTPSAPDEAPEGLSFTGDPCFNILASWTHVPAVTCRSIPARRACRSACSSSDGAAAT